MLTINKINFSTSAQLNTNKNSKTQTSLNQACAGDTVSFSGKKSAKQVAKLSHELAEQIGLLDALYGLGRFDELERTAKGVFERPVQEFIGMDGARGLYNSGSILAKCHGKRGLSPKGEIIDPENAATSLALMMETSKKMLRATQVNKSPDVQEYLFSKSRELDRNRITLFSIIHTQNYNPDFLNLYAQKLNEVDAKYPLFE